MLHVHGFQGPKLILNIDYIKKRYKSTIKKNKLAFILLRFKAKNRLVHLNKTYYQF